MVSNCFISLSIYEIMIKNDANWWSWAISKAYFFRCQIKRTKRRSYKTFHVDIVVVLIYFTAILFSAGDKHQGGILITHLCCLTSVAAVISRRHEGPGEMGKAVVIPKDEQEKMKELFKINQFNLMASDMIALNRSLPDVRLDGCVSSVPELRRKSAVQLGRILHSSNEPKQGCRWN